MRRLGLNHGGYFGERVALGDVLEETLHLAPRLGWQVHPLPAGHDRQLCFLHRPAASEPPSDTAPRRIYVSTGIHGDEPAGPIALQSLIREDAFPRHADVWLCPCLNPTGCARLSRENADGLDLNRDYLDIQTPEVRAHVTWLQSLPTLDLTLLLHEDWEATGFYLYELNLSGSPSLAPRIVQAVHAIAPIETAAEVDGRPMDAPGIVRPPPLPELRKDWPEALWLLRHKTRLSYTLESPSDYPIPLRIAILTTAVRAALAAFHP